VGQRGEGGPAEQALIGGYQGEVINDKSIEEAREDYRQGRVRSHEEVFTKTREG